MEFVQGSTGGGQDAERCYLGLSGLQNLMPRG